MSITQANIIKYIRICYNIFKNIKLEYNNLEYITICQNLI